MVNYSVPLASLVKPSECSNIQQAASVDVYASDDCGQTPPVTCTFTVGAYPGGLAISACPGDPSLSGCATQAQIDAAWNAWVAGLQGMTASGGCSPQVVYSQNPATLTKPLQCSNKQQVVSVDVHASDFCGNSQTVTCTFTVGAYPGGLAISACPGDPSLSGCATQADIDAAFATWVSALQAMTASGGCSPQVVYSEDPATLAAPSECSATQQVVSVDVYASDHCGNSQTVTCTFTVGAYPGGLAISACPGDPNLSGCATQAQIDAAWNAWVAGLQGMTASGGCSPQVVYSQSPASLTKPLQCSAAQQVVSVDVHASDFCGNSQTVTCTFTVGAYPGGLAISACPGDPSLSGCSTQAQIDAAWNAWVAGLQGMTASGGCSPQVVYSQSPATLTKPLQCSAAQQVVSVDVHASDFCGNSQTVTCTFTVGAYPGGLAISACPGDPSLSGCSTQAQIDAAWNAWVAGLQGMTASGGCSPQVVYSQNPATLAKPLQCSATQQSVSVQVFARDHCGQSQSVTCTFTVGAYPGGLAISACPGSPSLSGCATQAQIDNAWNAWVAGLQGMTASGGCSPQVVYSQNPATLTKPLQCSNTQQSVSVQVFARDHCGQSQTVTCTFTVGAYPGGLAISACPGSPSLSGCATQAQIDNAWNAWVAGLQGMTASGGCSPQVVYSQNPATLTKPLQCSNTQQSVSVQVFARDHCGQSQSVTCTFTVGAYPGGLAISTCPGSPSLSGCATQAQIDAAWNAWIAGLQGMTASGGCSPQVVYSQSPATLTKPLQCSNTQQVVSVQVFARDHCGQSQTVTCTFTVAQPAPLMANCPPDQQINDCWTQTEVNDAYAAWIAQFTPSGGCNAQGSDLSQYSPPHFCGGSVTVNYSVTDDCGRSDNCSATFTVSTGLAVSCPLDKNLGPCTSQAEVNQAFAAWIGQFSTTGGCNPQSTDLSQYYAPSFCGGRVTVIYKAKDICGREASCSANFTVAGPAPLQVHCPGNTTIGSCLSQAQVNSAFASWLNQFSTTGGCYAESSNLQSYAAPSYCGGSVIVKYYAWDRCGQSANCSAVFTVAEPPPLEVHCPQNVKVTSYSTQAQINNLFNSWLNKFTVTGGCSPQHSSLQNYSPPGTSGGSVTVNFYAWDKCGNWDICSATFVVVKQSALAVSCPQPVTLAPCTSQSAVNAAFASWKAQFSATGGCARTVTYSVNGQQVSSLSNVAAPSACGGSVTIAIQAYDQCNQQAYCSAMFSTKGDPLPPKVIPAKNMTVECDGNGNTTALNTWLAARGGATASDNCGQVFWSNNFNGLSNGCGETGSATVTFTARDLCGNAATTTAAFTIIDSAPPHGTCPAGQSGLTSPAQAPGPNPAAIAAAYSDNCSSVNVAHTGTVTQQGGNCAGFEVRHSYSITDACGRSTSCTVVHRGGGGGGAITGNCPPWVNGLECQDGLPEFNASYIASFFTGGDGQPVSVTPVDTITIIDGCLFTVTYYYLVRDNCGNRKECAIRYTGEDSMPPSGNCPQGGLVQSYGAVPLPDTNYIRQFYSDECSDISIKVLPRTSSGGPCSNLTVYNNYEISDWCGNTTLCAVPYFVERVDPSLLSCPPDFTGMQCWADVPTQEEAEAILLYYFTPASDITFISQTVINNFCQFTIRYAYQVIDPCIGERKICVLTFTGQDLTDPAPTNGGCPEGLSGLACMSDVPAPDPDAVAAGYTDNCSSVHAYLISTVKDGDECGDFTVTYEYHVYDDCDNYVVCFVTHSGTGGPEEQPASVGSEALDMIIYPNPSSGELFLEFKNQKGERAELSIYNIYGKRLDTRTLDLNSPKYRLDLAQEGLASGAYFISIQTESAVIVRTVVFSRM